MLGDHHGKVVSLGERECSLQRRHQKVVEEAPSTVVSPELRRRMGEAAVAAAKAVGYTNAGTCEFLLDADGNFYFLEMNTRLQVEHPVTELVTGLDLVVAQLEIAQGEPLGPEFDDVEPRGHAIEVRLYAEDPYRSFAPVAGQDRSACACRRDRACATTPASTAAREISIHYDPMIAKLIVWGRDRDEALRRLGARARRAAHRRHPHQRAALRGAARRRRLPRRALRHPLARPPARRAASCCARAATTGPRSAAHRRGDRPLRAQPARGGELPTGAAHRGGWRRRRARQALRPGGGS